MLSLILLITNQLLILIIYRFSRSTGITDVGQDLDLSNNLWIIQGYRVTTSPINVVVAAFCYLTQNVK